MRLLSLAVLALVVACSAGDVTDPTVKRLTVDAPSSLAFDRTNVDVKLSTNRKGAQFTAPTVTARGFAGAVILGPALAKCQGTPGIYSRESARDVASDTTFQFPMMLCIAPSGVYETGTFTVTARAIVGRDTLTATATVTVR